MIYFVHDGMTEDLELVLSRFDSAILILQNISQFEQIYQNIRIEINQNIIFFDLQTQELFESYTINNKIVKQKLGHVEETTMSFVWEDGLTSNFIERRSNFHGLKIKGMTEFTGTLMNAKSSYIDKAPFIKNIDSYQIENFTYGVFNDVLKFLEQHYNFSTTLYKRKEAIWGQVHLMPNGSYIGTGIVGDVFHGRADIAVATLGITLARANHVDFLTPITKTIAAVYIPNLDSKELIDLNAFECICCSIQANLMVDDILINSSYHHFQVAVKVPF